MTLFVFYRQNPLTFFSQPACSRLWCTTSPGEENGCRTQHMPWADGTGCGAGHWCMKSECVPKEEQVKGTVDGQWGEWKRYSMFHT